MTSPIAVAGRRLLLRADGSATVGLGHVMRLLALGQAWVDAGGLVEAVVEAPEPLLERYRSEGFDVRPTDDDLGDLLRADPTAVAAVDLADLGLDDLGRLSTAASRTLVVDDMALLSEYPVGLVLNQNAHADPQRYRVRGAGRLLLGLPYVLLRREFRSVPDRTVAPAARRLLVTFGGGDPTGMTARTLEAIATLPAHARAGLEVRAVVGAANAAAAEIAKAASTATPTVVVERAVKDMTEVMMWADLAITSGGSTVWELARTGCPALVLSTVPAEIVLAEGLRAVALFDTLGPAADLDQERLGAAIASRLGDAPWRRQMARRGQDLVDGHGAARVVEALAALDAR